MGKYILSIITILVLVALALTVFGIRRGCYGHSHESPDIPSDEGVIRLY